MRDLLYKKKREVLKICIEQLSIRIKSTIKLSLFHRSLRKISRNLKRGEN